MTDTPLSLSESIDRMRDLVANMASLLVDAPDQVRVETETAENETVLRLYVAPDDIGKVIGKQGRTARSLRTILVAAGSRSGHRFTLDVLEA